MYQIYSSLFSKEALLCKLAALSWSMNSYRDFILGFVEVIAYSGGSEDRRDPSYTVNIFHHIKAVLSSAENQWSNHCDSMLETGERRSINGHLGSLFLFPNSKSDLYWVIAEPSSKSPFKCLSFIFWKNNDQVGELLGQAKALYL